MLSIIMPVFNAAPYLEETVASVLAQTFHNFELILVDDGSVDASGAICDALAKRDSRICVIHKENGGVASARNAGLDAARGEFIGWVDSDDLISPIMYETMITMALEYNADIVQCSHVRSQDKLVLEMPMPMPKATVQDPIVTLKSMYCPDYTNYLALWSKIYRRTLFEEIRFTEGAAFEDDERVPLILYRGKKHVLIDLPLYCYVKRPGSIITAPSVKNILALTQHLENRMFWAKTIDDELYRIVKRNFFFYLREKICEELFWDTDVQKKAVELLKEHKALFRDDMNRYERITVSMLYWGKPAVKWVAKNDFAPIQNILAVIKKVVSAKS